MQLTFLQFIALGHDRPWLVYFLVQNPSTDTGTGTMFEMSAGENLRQDANETSRMACSFDPGRTMSLTTSARAWRIDHSQLQNAKPEHGCSMAAAIKVQARP